MSIITLSENEQYSFILQMLNKSVIYTWDVHNVKIASESSYQYINVYPPIPNTTIQLEIKERSTSRKSNVLTRTVLVEKIGCKKSDNDEDPILIWSLQELEQHFFANKREFILTRIDNQSLSEKIWFLSNCTLLYSDIWEDSNSKKTINKTIISIKPASMLEY